MLLPFRTRECLEFAHECFSQDVATPDPIRATSFVEATTVPTEAEKISLAAGKLVALRAERMSRR